MILCNIGNTNATFLDNGKFYNKSIEEFVKNLPKIQERVFYINVNCNLQNMLNNQKNFTNLEPFFQIDTSYVGLGIDRIVACFGIENAIVVDAGSAITIDIMSNKMHLGGTILPGLLRYKNAYESISPRLKYELNTAINLNAYPLCTKDAISYGAIKSVILCIKEMAMDKKIIFTGGDGAFLSGFFEKSIFDKLLIHRNMQTIIKQNNLAN